MIGSLSIGQSFSPLAVPRAPASPPNNAIPTIAQSAKADEDKAGNAASGKSVAGGEELTEEEEKVVRDLKQRDAEVRAHEEAHARVGGSYASAPTYEFQEGPDGKKYAIGGEVQIDASPIEGKPEATIQKLDIVIRAALAPAEPSSQDLRVAQAAREAKLKAQTELNEKREKELHGEEDENTTSALDPQTSQSEALSSLLKIQEGAATGKNENNNPFSAPPENTKNKKSNTGITNAQNTQAQKAYRDPLEAQNIVGASQPSDQQNAQNEQLPTALLQAVQNLESFSALA